MKIEIKIPALGESISEATIGQIFVKNGQTVAADAELLELETDKVNQVLYAPQAGVVNLTVKPGDTIKIGQVIGTIDSSTQTKQEPVAKPAVETAAPPPADSKTPPENEKKRTEAEASSEKSPVIEELYPGPTDKKQAFPSLRKTKESFVAELLGNDTRTMVTPPVQPEKVASQSGDESRKPLSKIRKVTAKRLVEAQQTTAMLTTFNEIDMSQVIFLREKHQESFTKKYGTKLGFMSFFVEAVTSALEAFPNLNSYIDGDDIVSRNYFNIGIAVGAEKGTFVPVLRNCDKLSFGDIEQSIASYAKKARDGKLQIEDLQGGGFTITNGGVYGSLFSTPILNPPQSGILGMHKIEKRPVVIDDQIVIRPMMYVALSYDHRIVDGKESVSFLVHVKNVLEDPARLLLDI